MLGDSEKVLRSQSHIAGPDESYKVAYEYVKTYSSKV